MFHELDDPTPPPLDGDLRRGVRARVRERRRRRVAVGGVAGVAVLGVGGLYARAANRLGDVDRLEIAGTGSVVSHDPVSILVLGTDTAEVIGEPIAGGAARSDSLVLLRVDPAEGTVRMTSLPRDLDVSAPGAPVERLNSVLGSGGPGAVVAQVEALGFPVDHVVLVDFGAFVDLVDMIGGVQVRIDAPLRDPHSGLLLDTPGCVRLDGAQALSLVRARHLQWFDGERWVADPTGDLGRMDRQRAFVAALLGAARSELPSPWTADRLAAWVQEHLTVDSSLDTTTLLGLARDALDTDSWVIEDEPFPVVSATRDGAAVLQPAAEAGAVAEWFRSSSGTEAPSVPAAGVPIGRCD